MAFIRNGVGSSPINALSLAKEYMETPFVLLDCDIYITPESIKQFFLTARQDSLKDPDIFAHMAVVNRKADDKKSVSISGNRVVGFDKNGYVDGFCGGMIYLFYRSPLALCNQLLSLGIERFSHFLDTLVKEEKIMPAYVDELWDNNTFEDIKYLEDYLLQHQPHRYFNDLVQPV